MDNLKCKFCNGNIIKNGVIYECENCGAVFNKAEISNNTPENSPKDSPEDIVLSLIAEGKRKPTTCNYKGIT